MRAICRRIVVVAAASAGWMLLTDNQAAAAGVASQMAVGGPPGGISCQPADVLEGEFESGHGCGIPVDTFNGGCGSVPRFSPIACGQTICGSSASDGVNADEDWYVITVTNQTTFTWSMLESSVDWFLAIFSIEGDCTVLITRDFEFGAAGQTGSCAATLVPGTYYFAMSAYPPTTVRACPSPYRVRLSCVELPPPANDLCGDAVALDVPGSVRGSNVGALQDPSAFDCGGTSTGRGVWYSFTGTGTTVTATTCSPNTTMNTRLLVYCGGCERLFCVGGNDNDNVCNAPGFTPRGRRSTVSFCTTPGTTYYVLVASDQGAEGNFELLLSENGAACDGAAPCEALNVECHKGDVAEGEVEAGAGCGVPVDTFNGGCNSVPEVYGAIECGQTICGSVEFDGVTRDTDWYLITTTNSNTFTFSMLEASFDWVLMISDINLGCGAPVEVPTATGQAGHSGSLTAVLGPGTYRLFVAPNFTDPVACPSGYRVSLSCGSPCTEDCTSGAGVVENEANCGLPMDTVNGGCTGTPPAFSSIYCPGDYYAPHCGTIAVDGDRFDTDWYVFHQEFDCQAEYVFEISADFPFVAGYVEWEPGYEGAGDCARITGELNPSITGPGDCVPRHLKLTVGRGTHWIFIAPQLGGEASCKPGSRNRYILACLGGTAMTFDCNENCVNDELEVKSGAGRDCFDYGAAPGTRGQPNGILDECECVADWNRDGVTNSTDVSDFINTFFLDQSAGGLDADINCDGTSNSTDVSDFINVWFGAQAGQLPFAGCAL